MLSVQGKAINAVEALPDIEAVRAQIGRRRRLSHRPSIKRSHQSIRSYSPVWIKGGLSLFPATEEEKTFTGVERVALFLQSTHASKRTTLVVIGGGILQDIGAFYGTHLLPRHSLRPYSDDTVVDG